MPKRRDVQHTEHQFDTFWEDNRGEIEPDPFDYGSIPEPDGEARRCIDCEKNMLGQTGRVCNECLAEKEVVRKMPVCGKTIHATPFRDDPGDHYCILPRKHNGEHNCIPDGLTT